MNKELKVKMLKNAEIMLGRDIRDGEINCDMIKCSECPIDKYYEGIEDCMSSGKEWLQNWYNNNKEDNMELQTIDTSKWQWMMVSNNECLWRKRIVFFSMSGRFYALSDDLEERFSNDRLNSIFCNVHLTAWSYAKPIEKRKNTNLDVMWWGGVTKVYRDKGKDSDIYPINRLSTVNTISDKEFNELHLVNSHAEIKNEKWLTADELGIV